MESVKVTRPSPVSSSPLLPPSSSSSAQSQHQSSQLVYTPRLKKVLKSYRAAATKSLNGPDWVNARSLSLSSPSVSCSPTPPHVGDGDSKPFPLSSASMVMSDKRVLSLDEVRESNNNHTKVEGYDPFLAPPPFPIQQPPIFTPPDQNRCERSETILENETISCFTVGGEKRLCLPQILTTVLREFSLQQINNVCDEMQIFCSRCTNDQLEVLKVNGIIPASAPSCGLITKTDAERLCAALLHSNPPKTTFTTNCTSKSGNGKKIFTIKVYHECFGKCTGLYVPSLYVQPFSGCIECFECHGLFAPQKFVCHSHRSKENRTCHWGFDSSNWRAYLLLYKEQILTESVISEREEHLTEMKRRFDFRRKLTVSPYDDVNPLESAKRLKVEDASSAPTSSSTTTPSASGLYSYPSYVYSPYSWAVDPSMLMYWYPAIASSGNNPNSLAARLSAFKPWSPGGSIGEGKHIALPQTQGYANSIPTHKFTDPPVLKNPENIAKDRADRHFEPNVSLAPSDANNKHIHKSQISKVNEKVKALNKDKINYPDDDSLSSTATFSSENASLSDDESAPKSDKIFANLQLILHENNVDAQLKIKIINEVENIVKTLIKTSPFTSLAAHVSRAPKLEVPFLSAPKKKLLNGLASQILENKEKLSRRASEEIRKNESSKMLSKSPLTLMPVISCSPCLVKSEPCSSPTMADPKINCVH